MVQLIVQLGMLLCEAENSLNDPNGHPTFRRDRIVKIEHITVERINQNDAMGLRHIKASTREPHCLMNAARLAKSSDDIKSGNIRFKERSHQA